MTGFLLDTNVLSELRRKQPNAALVSWWRAVPEQSLRISVLTLGEIRYGVEKLALRDSASAAVYERWMAQLITHFGDRLLSVDHTVAQAWGQLRASRPIPVVDSLLAATALAHDLTLVTRNTRDFADLGISLFNPFDAG